MSELSPLPVADEDFEERLVEILSSRVEGGEELGRRVAQRVLKHRENKRKNARFNQSNGLVSADWPKLSESDLTVLSPQTDQVSSTRIKNREP